MKHISTVALVLNLLFLCFNSLFLYFNIKINVATCRLDDQVRDRTAELIVHEFINNSRNHISEYSFDISHDRVHYEPEGTPLPYDVNLVTSEYSDSWRYKVQFHGGKAHSAEVRRLDSNNWRLDSFWLIEPQEVDVARNFIRIFVEIAQAHMREHNLSSVNYNTLVDANCFSHYSYPFLDGVKEWVDLTSFDINESNTIVEAINTKGDKVTYTFAPLKD